MIYYKKILSLFLSLQLILLPVSNNLHAEDGQPPQQSLDKETEKSDGDVPDNSAIIAFDVIVFVIAFVAYQSMFDITSSVPSFSQTLFKWSARGYIWGLMAISVAYLAFGKNVDKDISSIAVTYTQTSKRTAEMANRDTEELEKYISYKSDAVKFVFAKMALTYTLAAAWVVATVAAIIEQIYTPKLPVPAPGSGPAAPVAAPAGPVSTNVEYWKNNFLNLIIQNAIADDKKTNSAVSALPMWEQVLFLTGGTVASVMFLFPKIQFNLTLLQTDATMRSIFFGASTLMAFADAQNLRTKYRQLLREKQFLVDLKDRINNDLAGNKSDTSNAQKGLITRDKFDPNTIFSSTNDFGLPDCRNNRVSPECPIVPKDTINDVPPTLEEVAKQGMNIGLAKNMIGSTQAMVAATKSGNYNQAFSNLLKTGGKNALSQGLKDLKKVITNVNKENAKTGKPPIDPMGDSKKLVKQMFRDYNQAIDKGGVSKSAQSAFPQGTDFKLDDAKVDKLVSKSSDIDGLIKQLDSKTLKPNFVAGKPINEDDKKDGIVNLFSGGDEGEKASEESPKSSSLAPTNGEEFENGESEISNDPSKNIFKLISVRYFKTAYPLVLDSEANVAPPLAPNTLIQERVPASK